MSMRRSLVVMLSITTSLAVTLALALSLTIGFHVATAQAATGNNGNGVEVSAAVQHDVSPPLRDMNAAPLLPTIHGDRPMRLLPAGPGGASPQAPGALQSAPGPQVATTNGLNFNGVGDTSNTPLILATARRPTRTVPWVRLSMSSGSIRPSPSMTRALERSHLGSPKQAMFCGRGLPGRAPAITMVIPLRNMTRSLNAGS